MKINEHDKKEIKGCMKLLEKIEKSEEKKGFKWTNLEQVFEIINKQEELIIIMEKYFERIVSIGYDYDGYNDSDNLKKIIDELVWLARLGRVSNTTEVMYEDGNGKKYNILHEEIKGEENERKN